MLIYAFTDVHGNEKLIDKLKKESSKADLVVCTGDMTVFETDLRRVIKQFSEFGKKVLLIHGNHEDDESLKEECLKYKNIVFLHKNFYEQDGFLFVGYGGGGFARRDLEFENFTKEIVKKKKNNKLVMLFHQPPSHTTVDIVPGFGHTGSISFTEFIKKEKPVLTICGHIHEAFGMMDLINKKSLVVNPGPFGKYIEL